QAEIHWHDQQTPRGHCGYILTFDPTQQSWVEGWQLRSDESGQQRTWAPTGVTDCEDTQATGPSPDFVTLLADMPTAGDLLLCWFPQTVHGCETLLPHELAIAEPQLVWNNGLLFLELTGIEIHGYRTPELTEGDITEDQLMDPPIDLLLLYVEDRLEARRSPPSQPQTVWGSGLSSYPEGHQLTVRLDLENPDGHLLATTGSFTLQVPAP
ncbi:MAG: hypothetical protein GY925_12405, partial [Actinomycetia bacterium]|nr:hypothetical protein [Actinomycetes bacterium]